MTVLSVVIALMTTFNIGVIVGILIAKYYVERMED